MRLHAERTGAGAPRLVLMHGFTQTGRSWATITADLAQDHEVVTVDAPGHGRSGAVDADLPTAAALLGAAGGRAVYAGYSMGGRLALHLAVAEPELVQGLVLLGVTAGIDDPPERAARRAADEALADDIERGGVDAFLVRWLAGPLFAGLAPEAAELDDRRTNTAAGLAMSLRRCGTGTQEPLWDRLSALTMPVLVLAGEHDTKFTALGHRLAEPLARGTFAAIPGAGHAAHLEQPEAFLGVLRPWLADQFPCPA